MARRLAASIEMQSTTQSATQLSEQHTMTNETANTTDNTGLDSTPASTSTAFVVKDLDRAVKVQVLATVKDKKIQTLKDGRKIAIRNLTIPGRQYSVPTASSIIAAVQSEANETNPDAQPVIGKLLELCDAALSRIAAAGTATGTDTVYASLEDAAKVVTLAYTLAQPPMDWQAWLTLEPATSGTRTSDLSISQAQDALLEGWLRSMYAADEEGNPVDKDGNMVDDAAKAHYPPQALGWRLVVAGLRAKLGKASMTVAALADMLTSPSFVGIKPGQAEKLCTWRTEQNLALPTADDLPDDQAIDKATLRALETFSQAEELALAGNAETASLDF